MYRPKILIVDDKVANLIALETVLKKFDASILRATSGEQALNIALERDISLIITDVQMPGMDGFEMVKYMKSLKKTKDIPVIFISAIYSDDFYKIKGVESGGIDFLTKPIVPQILTGKVKLFLELVSKKKEVERELAIRTKIARSFEISNKRYQTIFQSTPIGLWERDFSEVYTALLDLKRSGINDLKAYFKDNHEKLIDITNKAKFLDLNQALLDLFKANNMNDLYSNIDKIVSKEFYNFLIDEMVALASGHSSYESDTIMYNLHKEMMQLSVRWVEVPTEGLRYERVIFSFIDNTTLIEQKIALIDARDKAEAATRAKADFLATMSHEIRTPMNGVIGMTELLGDTLLTPEQEDYVSTIQISGYSLLNIINDILDFSKIESGKMELDFTNFSLSKTLDEVFDLLRTKVNDKGLNLMYHINQNLSEEFLGDVSKLKQILVNLINNAIKFTHSGGIYITVSCIDNCDNKSEQILRFDVKDTGVGISSEKISKLFRVFSQVDSSVSRKYGGTGLGLAISKSLTELMGGKIWVDSSPNIGSEFHFTIKMKTNKQIKRATTKEIFTNAIVIDKDEHSCGMLVNNLHPYFKNISIYSSYLQLQNSKMTDIDMLFISFDIFMNFNNELLQQLKTNSNINKIALYNVPDAYKDCPEFISLLLNNPFKQSFLSSKLIAKNTKDQVIRKTSNRIDRDLASSHPHTILLAEDNKINQKLAKKLLNRMGYTIDLAENGNDVIELMLKKTYDIIFMDIQMPIMDGLATSSYIREKLSNEEVIIVAMTANAMQGDKENCLKHGMNDYIAKPIDIIELQDLLRKY